MASYANRQMWNAYETMRPVAVVRTLERTGVPKRPSFRPREWDLRRDNKIGMMKLRGMRIRPGLEVMR